MLTTTDEITRMVLCDDLGIDYPTKYTTAELQEKLRKLKKRTDKARKKSLNYVR